MAKSVSVSQFFAQVKQEALKVTWSDRKEVIASTVMVLLMVVLVALFFFVVDTSVFYAVQAILGF